MKRLTRVRIPAVWFGGNQTADFKLGMGPCGKYVERLEVSYELDNFVSLVQHHDDDTLKVFRYRLADLCGRIEEEYT